MPTPQIRINKTKELQSLLNALRGIFRCLNDAEIVKVAVARLYRAEVEEERNRWAASLPHLELSNEEQASLTEGIMDLETMEKDGTLKEKSVEEIMKEIST
jgi:hypothetical protein